MKQSYHLCSNSFGSHSFKGVGVPVAAVVKPSKGPSNGKVFTDQDWNDEAKADPETGYYLSKVCLPAVKGASCSFQAASRLCYE